MTMYRVRVQFSGLQGAPYLATHYFDTAGGTAQQAVDQVGLFWSDMDANLDSELIWTTLTPVDTINEATGALVSSTATGIAAGAGATVGPVLPFASQGLVRWSTAGIVAGKRVRGRTFIPGITELGTDNGVLTTALITAFNTHAATYVAGAVSTPVIWARPFAGKVGPPVVPARAGTMHPITSGSAWNQLAVLRSRRD